MGKKKQPIFIWPVAEWLHYPAVALIQITAYITLMASTRCTTDGCHVKVDTRHNTMRRRPVSQKGESKINDDKKICSHHINYYYHYYYYCFVEFLSMMLANLHESWSISWLRTWKKSSVLMAIWLEKNPPVWDTLWIVLNISTSNLVLLTFQLLQNSFWIMMTCLVFFLGRSVLFRSHQNSWQIDVHPAKYVESGAFFDS